MIIPDNDIRLYIHTICIVGCGDDPLRVKKAIQWYNLSYHYLELSKYHQYCIAAACIYIVYNITNKKFTISRISNITGISRKKISDCYKIIARLAPIELQKYWL